MHVWCYNTIIIPDVYIACDTTDWFPVFCKYCFLPYSTCINGALIKSILFFLLLQKSKQMASLVTLIGHIDSRVRKVSASSTQTISHLAIFWSEFQVPYLSFEQAFENQN